MLLHRSKFPRPSLRSWLRRNYRSTWPDRRQYILPFLPNQYGLSCRLLLSLLQHRFLFPAPDRRYCNVWSGNFLEDSPVVSPSLFSLPDHPILLRFPVPEDFRPSARHHPSPNHLDYPARTVKQKLSGLLSDHLLSFWHPVLHLLTNYESLV